MSKTPGDHNRHLLAGSSGRCWPDSVLPAHFGPSACRDASCRMPGPARASWWRGWKSRLLALWCGPRCQPLAAGSRVHPEFAKVGFLVSMWVRFTVTGAAALVATPGSSMAASEDQRPFREPSSAGKSQGMMCESLVAHPCLPHQPLAEL